MSEEKNLKIKDTLHATKKDTPTQIIVFLCGDPNE